MNTDKKKKAVKNPKKPVFFRTILFEITLVNLIMLCAFGLVMYQILNSMETNNETSRVMSEYVLNLSRDESLLKSDIMSLYDQTLGYVDATAQETREALLPEIESAKEAITNDIDGLTESAKDSANAEDITYALSEIRSDVDRMIAYIDSAIAETDKGNTAGANEILFNKAELQKVAAFHMTKKIDDEIIHIENQNNATADKLLASGKAVATQGNIIFVILIVLNFIISWLFIVRKINSISRGINHMISDINDNNGDLTCRINTRTGSELVYIVNGFNHFIETLQTIMRDVKHGAGTLNDSSRKVSQGIENANSHVSSTSAAMEQLSAGMQSMETIVDSIDAQVGSVRTASMSINRQAAEGSTRANAIKAEADQIQSSVLVKKENMQNRVNHLSEVLAQSLKNSEKVEEIDKLTKTILDIAFKTNILALNASIEAARAGKAGQSFAVVANEISTLASNSQAAAADISRINEEVTSAVTSLSTNAQDMLGFINSEVIADYDDYVETGEKYEQTAGYIHDLLADFHDNADHLDKVMTDMTNSISTISCSVKESTQAVNMTAANTVEIASEIQTISEAAEENTKVSGRLNDTAGKFTHV
uniref:methyl-accepting chemotaxis protein n=1 Tax=Eubacterium cellulosolvens TaxID=29322 RepID=UPI00048431DE|nr:methyl-accepting chemotaxis protein [[Eubacterium] cellulosolvens]